MATNLAATRKLRVGQRGDFLREIIQNALVDLALELCSLVLSPADQLTEFIGTEGHIKSKHRAGLKLHLLGPDLIRSRQ